MIFSWACPTALAQNGKTFSPADTFSIRELNGAIKFAVNGTYSKSTLENGTWTFENLSVNYSFPIEKFRVSTQNSNVTIFMASASNTTFQGAFLNYTVEGQGTQTINFGVNIQDARWSVIFNEIFIAEGEGWTISPDQTLTITEATGNVTLYCLSITDFFGGGRNNANLPFYQQHSVVIVTAVAVVVMVVLAVGIWARHRGRLTDSGLVRIG
jgi:hypothetical protein